MFNRDPIAVTETETSKPGLSLFGSLTTDVVVLGGTLGLAFVGVAITFVNRDLSYLYWFTMIPVFGTLCFFAQWSHRRGTEVKWTRLFLTELLHWGGLLLAVVLLYTLLSAGKIPRDTTGMVIMLLFALVTFLYGVHLDRRFLGVGIFLGLSYVVMMYLAAYIWVLLLVVALAVSVAIFLVKRVYSQQAATSPATRDVPGTAGVTSDTTQEIGDVHS
ncbi:MAG: hypothetical protein M3461_09870 [Pseudomonadota bacterium]|nr:hypothetical protein [Pseudomonadota bacterium]